MEVVSMPELDYLLNDDMPCDEFPYEKTFEEAKNCPCKYTFYLIKNCLCDRKSVWLLLIFHSNDSTYVRRHRATQTRSVYTLVS